MESLNRGAETLVTLLLVLVASSCGDTVTKVDYLETDTFLSSADIAGHGELKYLALSKSATAEERTIVKLPTGKRDKDKNLEDTLANPLAVPFFVFYILSDILEDIFSCHGYGLSAASLTNAKLVFDVIDNQEGVGTLSGKISLGLLGAPWWQSADWYRAHHFSEKHGVWASPGGDLDPSFTAVDATETGTAPSSKIEFDITPYFSQLISTDKPVHYGMLLSSKNGTLGRVKLYSTQATTYRRPRVVSTYSCPAASRAALREFIYFLGNDNTRPN